MLFGFYLVSSGAPVLGGLYVFKLQIENIASGCRVSSLFAADPVAVCTHVDCAAAPTGQYAMPRVV